MKSRRLETKSRPEIARGFTLVELLVVITIIGILMSLMMPALQGARESTRRLQCANNLGQIELGIDQYAEHEQVYPAGREGCDDMTDKPWCPPTVPDPHRTGTSGFVRILPYMESMGLYQTFDFSSGLWQSDPEYADWHGKNTKALAVRPAFYVCPSDSAHPFYNDDLTNKVATGSYAFSMGSRGPSFGIGVDVKLANNGMFFYVVRLEPGSVHDGLSNTIFVGETVDGHILETSNRWTVGSRHLDSIRTTDNPLNCPVGMGTPLDLYGYKTLGAFASRHKAGGNFVFGDRHVVYIHDDIDTAVYRAISTRNGRETFGADKL